MATPSIFDEEKDKKPVYLIVLVVFALALGVAGMGLGFAAHTKAKAAADSSGASSSAAREAATLLTGLDEQVSSLSSRLDSLGAQLERIDRDIARLKTSQIDPEAVQRALSSAFEERKENRERLAAAIKELNTLKSTLASGGTPSPSRTVTPPAPTESATSFERSPSRTATPSDDPPEETDGFRTYRVQSGDTLQSIGRRYGVSLGEMLDANPGIDPRRLQIGQEVAIPVAE
ncbi:MAG: LysM peptidoglycan-binding domain-containing protein [Verrucomicrobiota bacterium]